MQDLILFALLSAVTAVYYRDDIKKLLEPAGRNGDLIMAAMLIFAAASAALKYIAPDSVFFVVVMWSGALAFYEYCCAGEGYARYPFYLLLMSSLLSVFMLPESKLTAYIFMPVFFMALFIAASMYRSIREKTGFRAGLSFMLFFVYSIKHLMLDRLSPVISVPVAVCAALFLFVRTGKPAEYYLEEKNLSGALAAMYVILFAQCVIAAILKNRIFF